MSSHSENFQAAHQAHLNWQVDRPLIDKFNHSDIKVALRLLVSEIDELNGGDKTGIFSEKNINQDHRLREDYRQQEISDIIVFAMTTFDELHEEVPTEAVYSRAAEIAGGFQFNLVDADRPMDDPMALSEEQNEIYGALRHSLNQEAAALKNYGGDQEKLTRVLTEILAYAVAMHSLIGVDSGRAVLEKVARNMLKYPAAMFALPEEELSPDDLEEHYHEQRSRAAALFDGEAQEYELIDGEYQLLDRSRQAVLDRDNLIKERPKTGTTQFYKRPEKVVFDHSEARPIGIFYRAAAQLLTWRLSYLLKRS